VSIIIGLRRISKTETLGYDQALIELLGLDQFPDAGSLRRFLKRLPTTNIRQIAQLHDSLRAWVFSLPEERHSLVLDVDSVVLVVYGHAEGAKVGYNPKKPGRRSIIPCFVSNPPSRNFGMESGVGVTRPVPPAFFHSCGSAWRRRHPR